MDAIAKDVQNINREFFRLALDPGIGNRVLKALGVTEAVASRIRGSKEEGRLTAIKCRMPLVTFAPAVDELVTRHQHDWPSLRLALDLPEEVQMLTRMALEVAWGHSRVDLTIPQIQFDLSRHAVEDLSRLGVCDLIAIANRPSVLLRVRAANQPLIWDRLMIGAHCEGARAARIAQQTALMSIGLDA